MAEGGDTKSGDVNPDLLKLITEINKNPKYKVLTADEYKSLLQNQNTGSPLGRGRGKKFSLKESPIQRLLSVSSHCDSHVDIPKLPLFSGSDDIPKGR